MSKRIEQDSIGKITIDSNKYWGAQTQRSLHNFAIGNNEMPISLIKAIAAIKMASAKTNYALKRLNKKNADGIIKVSSLIINGKLNNQFPLNVWQTGSGTQTNMNVNEVIANYANINIFKQKVLHPNDHVNLSQSSNDVFPSAIHVSTIYEINKLLLPSVRVLINTLVTLEKKFNNVIKVGRTHLQDATPITLGQEISGWRTSLENCIEQLLNSLEYLYQLPLGGTAVGTGINAPKGFDKNVINNLSTFYNLPFKVMSNKFNGLAFKERIGTTHSILKILATTLFKIANDIRFLSSGPRAGIGELNIPTNEPGSSIMPGKINPTQCEAIMMVCLQVFGNDSAISIATSQGNCELNTFMPLIAYDSLWSIRLLSDAISSFTKNCVSGININSKKNLHNLSNSLMLVTALTPKIGYTKAAEIAEYAYINNLDIKQAATKLKYISKKSLNVLLNPKKMI